MKENNVKKIITGLLFSVLVASLLGCVTPSGEIKPEQKIATKALWESDGAVDKIVVVSDIHLGVDDSFSEDVENRALFMEFLQRVEITSDIRELVIAGDFLDEWYLPLSYAKYKDSSSLYRQVIKTNQMVIDQLNDLMDTGIKVVYVVGNHDMTLDKDILSQAMPKLIQAYDAKGLGAYVTGDRNEIVIEHGHRYDVFSAPDTVTNRELCQNDDTLFPPGYFFARIATSWIMQGKPPIKKNYPVVTAIPDPKTNPDQYGAYLYYRVLETQFLKITPIELFEDPVFDLNIGGFNDKYSLKDFYPAQQEDKTISSPVLFKDFQRSWDERQEINQIQVKNSFIQAVSGTFDSNYFFNQAKAQYLENPQQNIDVVVFGHTHVPVFQKLDNDKYYVNDGTWIDHNNIIPSATRTFAVITTGNTDQAALYKYMEDGSLQDLSVTANK
ncbi:metallophosphoesterase [uncultured Sphaerochaeta sp.]|uniref:metallophosphoesterase n=1 Tax=uncultured Sphaerochaeta sp. TaxID=886478 RepID=UPI002A0A64EF|nr:metallophosphoesterase [uncultured Sphaerochaeta sp.]